MSEHHFTECRLVKNYAPKKASERGPSGPARRAESGN